MKLRVLWPVALTAAIATGGSAQVLAPAGASPPKPTRAQVVKCGKFENGHTKFTKGQVNVCLAAVQQTFIPTPCPSGPKGYVIDLHGQNAYVIRDGSRAIHLGPGQHSATTVDAICNGSPTATPRLAVISPLMAGNAHPVVPIPANAALNVDLVFVGTPIVNDGSTSVPVEVWNGTSKTVNDLDVSGAAKNATGTVIGSGDSQDIEPQNLSPGQVAFGMVYFETTVPTGSNLSSLVPSYHMGTSTYFLDVKTGQANYVPGQFGDDAITGDVTNQNPGTVTGPVSTVAYCFSAAGALLSVTGGFTSGSNDLAAGASGGYSDTLYDQSCPTFLVGSSGFGAA
jgi:hypothetical protein